MKTCTRTLAWPWQAAMLLLAAAAIALAAPARADPPSRVARLAFVDGSVSFSPGGDERWVQAQINRPLIAGDRLWADSPGRAELQYGSGAARIADDTSVELLNLDDRVVQLEVTQGTLQLTVRALDRDEIVEIATPTLAFRVQRPGRYRVDVEPSGRTTTVAVIDGGGEIYGESVTMRADAGLSFRFYGNDLSDNDVWRSASRDEFDRWASQRDRRYERLAQHRYVSPEMIGAVDLDDYGTWRTVGSNGAVWFPRDVDRDWAPYRYGHWSWVEPWGWTWVDDAPWGFAPFHYGRWTTVDGRWGWVPGPSRVRPVYAPAMVAFVGGRDFAASVSVGGGSAIGWFPLAPGEVYRPSYDVSRNYFQQVNVTNTTVNVTQVINVYDNRNVANVTYRNVQQAPAAVTVVPATVFAQAQPVHRNVVRVERQAIARTQVTAVAPVAPAQASFVGAAPAARSKPPAEVLQRRVVATVAPAPAPAPVEQRMQRLQQTPGKPLPTTANARAQSGGPQGRGNAAAQPPGQAAAPGGAPPHATGGTPPANVRVVDVRQMQRLQAKEAAAAPRDNAPSAGERGRDRNAGGGAAPGRPEQPPAAGAPTPPGAGAPTPPAASAPNIPGRAAPPSADGAPPHAPNAPPTAAPGREPPGRAEPPGQARRNDASPGKDRDEPTARPGAPTPPATATPPSAPPHAVAPPGGTPPTAPAGGPGNARGRDDDRPDRGPGRGGPRDDATPAPRAAPPAAAPAPREAPSPREAPAPRESPAARAPAAPPPTPAAPPNAAPRAPAPAPAPQAAQPPRAPESGPQDVPGRGRGAERRDVREAPPPAPAAAPPAARAPQPQPQPQPQAQPQPRAQPQQQPQPTPAAKPPAEARGPAPEAAPRGNGGNNDRARGRANGKDDDDNDAKEPRRGPPQRP